jgi:tetratricopeptide (TPR) repeat protein
LTNAELLTFTASLKIAQGRPSKAYRLLDQAIQIYQEGQQLQSEGLTLIHKGLALGCDGHYKMAISAIRSGIALVGTKSPRLFLVGRLNLSIFLVDTDVIEEARSLIEKTRPFYCEISDPAILACLCWLEAALAEALGRGIEAEAAFQEARQLFLDQQNGKSFFFVSLDLARFYAEAGRRRQVREILEEAIPVGESIALPRQVLAARLLYEQASRV